jgi:hypothetical protein
MGVMLSETAATEGTKTTGTEPLSLYAVASNRSIFAMTVGHRYSRST